MATSHLIMKNFFICFLITTLILELNGFSIKLIPIDRFDIAQFPENLTLKERYEKISKISQTRIHRLESMASSNSMHWKDSTEHGQNTLQPPVAVDPYGYYLTNLSIGTRPYNATLLVDTGSPDTWVQCEGCTRCFRVRQGNFKRRESRSYRPIPCDHPLCVPKLCVNNSCAYNLRYVDSDYTKGEVGSDLFIFKEGTSRKMFSKTVFGCGLENYFPDWERRQNNTLAGIFGLNLQERSMLMQLEHETKRRISYCLPSLYSPGTYTLLNFGNDAIIRRKPGMVIHKTRLLQYVPFYAVEVLGMSIDGKRLPIDPKDFRMRPDRTGGFIIDTGSPHTALVEPAYRVVKNEIIRYFLEKYTWRPIPRRPGPGDWDLCYNIRSGNFTYPSMTFHFEKDDLSLPARNVFQFFEGGFCLMVMPTHGLGRNVLGAFQQANHRFLFDFKSFIVSFVSEECRLN